MTDEQWTPDDVRVALREAGERRAEGERQRAEAMADIARWVFKGSGVSVSEMSRLTGLTRQTIYDLLRR